MDINGEFASVGQLGEIVVKGSMVMTGYSNVDEEDQPFDKDGWFHTGDVGSLDSDGYLRFSSRLKDIIVRCGENVVPGEIEKAILASGISVEAKVVGASTDYTDELIVAVVASNSSRSVDLETLRSTLAAYIPKAWLPDELIVLEHLPRNATGKIDTNAINTLVGEKLCAANV